MDVSRFPHVRYIHLGGPLRIDAELEQPPQDLALAGRVRVRAVDEAETGSPPIIPGDRVARHERSRRDDEEVVATRVFNECCRRRGGSVPQSVVQRTHNNIIADVGGPRQRPRKKLRRVEFAPPSSCAFGPRRISDQRDECFTTFPPRIASLY